ncbi:MAG: isoaspartyl peptidase/L-asparaginase [Gammaproteobacteria bacterium]|nr:isoaspartyl peptidase/L-asparaginase [Gammaproteobacteria bacterium]
MQVLENWSQKILRVALVLFLAVATAFELQAADPGWGIVIHGGAGATLKENMTAEKERALQLKLSEVLNTGHTILENGGSSLDAVQAAIRIMEDSPLFNAGRGAVFTHEGTNEMDASIMDGRSRNSGAVAGVQLIKNPINLARLVMEKSPHVMMAGKGAESFAAQHDVKTAPAEYFYTEPRWDSLQKHLKQQNLKDPLETERDHKFGTVGAAALDKDGNLAAGTSTGGMTNKRFGRIGDSPVIGAGTYANNATCAVSATGHGEYFIRSVVAYDISALMEYKGMSLQKASDYVINDKLKKFGGSGGVIAIDKHGNVAMPFNTAGMFRGYVHEDGEVVIRLYNN